ncbi:hypothetical protein SAMN02910456_02257 [Ruminococcaceae bacterium YRB3002]|nr:hypothetical protein SAMN02910456_02257 [Ruminococcaceae bacterium YRB3002]
MNKIITDDNVKITIEEVLGNPDVALIPDSVESREELLESMKRYLMLTRRDRRFSDYYSVELYGCTVPDMFATMLYRFKGEGPLPAGESLLISEPDLYYNKKRFDEGKINLCFVIGYSGSGKSVLTREYEGDNLEKVELDDIVCIKDHLTMDDLKAKGDMLYSFFSGVGAGYYISREERSMTADHGEVFVKFIKYAFEYAAAHPEKRFILEGIWTYLFFDDPSEFLGCAVFMKGTSLAKSKLRRLKRESADSAEVAIDRLLEFGYYAKDTALHDGNVDKWRRFFERQEATVIKPEDNRFTSLRMSIMAEINEINRCFVHGDEDGIRSIMERAEDSADMDRHERRIVMEECKKALAD